MAPRSEQSWCTYAYYIRLTGQARLQKQQMQPGAVDLCFQTCFLGRCKSYRSSKPGSNAPMRAWVAWRWV